ncbi:MAG: triphosphoribosyl-dephospho-CoA synthase CitG [Ruminococcaceae bacterium]|nr:triphosphoribosyl-dephospho-CoA synthase CitG [Oscillospiraceae bacterium]
MMEVSLRDILNAREARVRRQQALLTEYRAPLLCFTMNIAGPVKTTPLIQRGFRTGLALLDSHLPQEKILFREVRTLPTGWEAYYVVSAPALALKSVCTDMEEKHPLGRLFDMDVINTDGTKLEREKQRGCIVCGATGRGCAASRAHSVEQLQTVTMDILTQYFRSRDSEQFASIAVQSLIDEVHTTPKPGLVDRRNNGSHKDMDVRLFEISARALQPYFKRCVQIGQETAHRPSEETFPLLRDAGLKAEKTMFSATGGINTHKGAIYTLGILCGSVGRLWSADKPIADSGEILAECVRIAHTFVQKDFASAKGKTAGERLYLQQGMRGIRGEIAEGLPSVRNIGLPCFRQFLADGFSENDAGVYTLLHLIANVADTNLYKRGGEAGAQWAAKATSELLSASRYPAIQQIEALDDGFIARNLSPGGCADLLAATYFLHKLAQWRQNLRHRNAEFEPYFL